MKITIVGTGYVGLVTGTGLADLGNEVVCVDINERKVEQMKNGIIPIYEPNLDELFQRNIQAERLFFTTDLKEAMQNSHVVFLALPTPPGEDGSADLSYVLGVAEQLAGIITDYTVVVNKSTVPVGTADKVTQLISSKTSVDFDVVSNPEFLREGFAVTDFMKPSRLIIGSKSEKAVEIMKKIYRPLTLQGTPILVMDEKSSELTKYAANAFLATKITFMNEVANYCEKVGANIDNIRLGMGSDERIGNRFLFPGIGYGGSCFPKDVKAMVKFGKEQDYNFQILESVEDVNQKQKVIQIPEILNYFQNNIKGKEFAIWGLAFKPNTDDIREASALEVIEQLLSHGANVTAYDPAAMNNIRKILGNKINFAENMYNALDGKDALIIATEWSEFRNPNFVEVEKRLNQNIIFDGRNLFDIKEMEQQNFYYNSIGRKTVTNG